MINTLSKDFIRLIDEFDNKKYLLAIIAYNVATTILGYKPSYLIIFHDKGKKNLYKAWEKYKQDLKTELNLSFYELKKEKCSTAVLFYNKDKISRVLSQKNNVSFLDIYGYKENMSLKESLELLKRRYEKVCPHEIGIFLGYPIEDVITFIKEPYKKALALGYWKVYHNLDEALNTFKKYDKVKVHVLKFLIEGMHPYLIIKHLNNIKDNNHIILQSIILKM